MAQIKFKGYNPLFKKLRSDGGFRVELDVSLEEYDKIKDLNKIEGDVMLDVTIDY